MKESLSMRYRLVLSLLVFLLPAAARAEEPEQLLPAGAQIYLRWDGVEAHRPAYEKTALGKMMKGDTGDFVAKTFAQIQEGLGSVLTVEQLLGGVPPEKLQKLQADANEAAKLLPLLGKNGFLIAIEVRGLEPPEGQITIILPDAGEKPTPLFGALTLVAGLNKVEVKEVKVGDRTVSTLPLGPVHLTWWAEGKHAVVTFGTDDAEKVVKTMTAGNGARLTASPLYKRMKGFDKFETSARAFVDVESLVKVASKRNKETAQLLDDLGLNGLKALVFYSGFDGEAERGLVEWDMPGPRKGLLSVFDGKPFTLADVPPLPPDVISWSMMNFDPGTFYDASYKAVEAIVGMVEPTALPEVKEFPKKVNEALGIDLRQDLIGSLGNQVMFYNSPSEGPLNFGQTWMVKVKDAKKLQESLEAAVKALGKLGATQVQIKKHTYKDVEVREIHVKQPGFIFVPTYAIHKDWLVVSLFPQSVHGYIARAKGDMAAWKPDPRTEKTFAALPKEVTSISYSDPRPGLNQLLSIAPLIGGAINSFSPETNFDVGSLPNAQEVTRHLFPNVSVTSDDGKTLRQETRASLALPLDVTGIDLYALFIAFSLARFGF
jgi:hypothetical protein